MGGGADAPMAACPGGPRPGGPRPGGRCVRVVRGRTEAMTAEEWGRDILADEQGDLAERLSQRMPSGVVLRSYDEVMRLFDGLALVDPGLVPLDQWRPDIGQAHTRLRATAHGGVARKP